VEISATAAVAVVRLMGKEGLSYVDIHTIILGIFDFGERSL
jgi:hypothetical protein